MTIEQIRSLSREYAMGQQPQRKRVKPEKRCGMRPCDRCLENNWDYSFDDGTRTVTATCKLCGHEVSWQKKDRPMTPERVAMLREKEKSVCMHHLYIPGDRPVDRPGKLPWED